MPWSEASRVEGQGRVVVPASPPLIVGLGNVLLGDDGVGVHAVRALARTSGPWAVEVGTAVLDALHLFEAASRILALDAMQAGGRPGTIYALSPAEVADRGLRGSLHELGLLAALGFLPHHRPEVAILGVEPARIDYGMELSPGVAGSLPRLVRLAIRLATDWELVRSCHPGGDGPPEHF